MQHRNTSFCLSVRYKYTFNSFKYTRLIYYSYLIENEICYLVMCDKLISKVVVFKFLEDIAREFYTTYGRRTHSVTRPYAFIEFDVYIQKAKLILSDRRRNINVLNTQLHDVQRIMV